MEMDNLVLPKWPQMIVTGEKVDESTALEIIRRTDDFFTWTSGNNHEFVDYVIKRLKLPDFKAYDDFGKYQAYREKWCKNWELLQMNYVVNSWISCPYIFGAHGWCHPDGTIGYFDNIGKWPSVEEVLQDWQAIATTFPFLQLEVTLMDGECVEEANPVVSMLIRDGLVQIVNPKERDVHKEFNREFHGTDDNACLFGYDLNFENSIPKSVIESWAKKYIDGKI